MKTKNIPKILLALTLIFLVSCSKSEENVPLTGPTAQITVEKIVRKASLRNQDIPFRILNENGDDVTDITTFFVDGVEITGSNFSSDVIGDFEVYGVYTENGVEITTNVEPFKVIIPKRKVVIEDYTGTWCGFCPSVAAAIIDTHELTEHLAIVAIHETANSSPDPYHYNEFPILRNAFNIGGLPRARINRTVPWVSPYTSNDIVAMAGQDTNLAIGIVSELAGTTLTVKVDMVFETGTQAGDKLVLYLIENGIIYKQTNYYNDDPSSPYYQLGNPILEFEHNEVLRQSLTQTLGNTIGAAGPLEEIGMTFAAEIPEDYDTNNLELVAMIVDVDNNARNAQTAHINVDQEYQ
ncbi:Omp28-related outer membrane protein [Ulvibacter antarcticus]|uniref:Outer membrane protein Omp28 n=1 Tax=Ulvibacter antarcticus TaxID=442714 RepID=A0A3L9YTC4_9FLAO|nr:Omp28-related outer membrane protein [Ulvibacter antarcticus]RMA57742.1 outer membrane protein Omp28 [Ulvibacter antarcticus]